MPFEVDTKFIIDNGASPEDADIAARMVTAMFEAAPADLPAHRLALCAVRAVAALVVVSAKKGKEAEMLASSAAFLRQKAERINPPRAN